ncbi:MAG: hypothetical protein L0Y71_24835 [Gemmataceae bacterium]|nr:hypothetical protein [Gemmataceae bacterium]
MNRNLTLDADEVERLDRVYREGGLRTMASPHIHYHEPACPHPGCGHKMEWIDFQLELFGDLEGIYKPLVKAWWEGSGFVGRCPSCGGWIRFTTLRMEPLTDDQASPHLKLPDHGRRSHNSARSLTLHLERRTT